MHPTQRLIFQSMTPEQKLKVAQMLIDSSRRLKAAALRAAHPDWTEKEIQDGVCQVFLYAGT